MKDCLFCVRHARYLVFILFYGEGNSTGPKSLRPAFIRLLSGAGRSCTAAGPLTERLDEVHFSYEQAVILLQCGFFFEPGIVLLPGDFSASPKRELALTPDEARSGLYEALISGQRENVDALTEQIRAYYSENMHVLPTEAKDLYYTLSHAIRDAARHRRILENLSGESFLSAMESCFSFSELHAGLTERIDRYFEHAGEVQENPVIKGIYDYIADHYMDEHLSVKAVSDHVFLSASYVCTLFKNETGQTLNHFITSYRMEMAKLLLADLRYTVSEVSSRVGYSDGNYFGKSFKKHCGLSPTEYREKALK